MLLNLKQSTDYKLIPEGLQKLKIVDAKCVPSGAPKQITIKFEDENGGSMIKNYKIDSSGAMFYFAKLLTALGVSDGETFDTNDIGKLINRYVIGDIAHTEYNGKTYADPTDYIPCEGDEQDVEETEEENSVIDDIEIDGL